MSTRQFWKSRLLPSQMNGLAKKLVLRSVFVTQLQYEICSVSPASGSTLIKSHESLLFSTAFRAVPEERF